MALKEFRECHFPIIVQTLGGEGTRQMVHPPPGTCEGGGSATSIFIYLFIYLFIYFQLSCEGDHLRKEPSFIKFVSSVRYPKGSSHNEDGCLRG